MLAKQKQVLESFHRVRGFVEQHPATGQQGFESAKASLDETLEKLKGYASLRLLGRDLGRAEIRRRAQMAARLRDRHMRKIVSIARAQIEPNSDVRLPLALRMPRSPLSVTRLLQASDAMIGAARPFEAVFLANGMAPDFLAEFAAARDALAMVVDERARLIGARIGASRGLSVQLLRGRRAVERLDAVVRAAFEGEEAILSEWRTAKRVQKRPGGSTASGPADGSPVVPAEMAVAA